MSARFVAARLAPDAKRAVVYRDLPLLPSQRGLSSAASRTLVLLSLLALATSACATTSGSASGAGTTGDDRVVGTYDFETSELTLEEEAHANLRRELDAAPEELDAPPPAGRRCETLGRFVCEPTSVPADRRSSFVEQCRATILLAATALEATHYTVYREPRCERQLDDEGRARCRAGEGRFFVCEDR
jgi:hypothetical protein